MTVVFGRRSHRTLSGDLRLHHKRGKRPCAGPNVSLRKESIVGSTDFSVLGPFKTKGHIMHPVKYWEIIAEQSQQSQLGLRLSDYSNGRTIWIVDARRDDGKRFVVRTDEKLTAFLELESAICNH